MDESVMIALISGLCVAVPSIITTVATIRKQDAIQNLKIEHIAKDITELSERVNRHNQLQERVALLENEVQHLQNN